MGWNPSHFLRGELVHSQAPPISPCPLSLLPWAVTGTGCQCWNPTLARSRSAKSSSSSSPAAPFEARDGGDSSTPLLMR